MRKFWTTLRDEILRQLPVNLSRTYQEDNPNHVLSVLVNTIASREVQLREDVDDLIGRLEGQLDAAEERITEVHTDFLEAKSGL